MRTRLILFYGVLAVTSSSFIIRFAYQSGDSPAYALAFVRVLLTGILSYFILNPSKQYTLHSKSDGVKILLAGFSLATHFGWWFDSLNYINISSSLSLTNTAPIWMALIGFIVYSAKLKLRQVMSIIFVTLGSMILFFTSQNTGDGTVNGLLLALGSAIGFAVYLLVARDLVPKYGLWRYFGMVNLATALVLGIWVLLNGQYLSLTSSNVWFFGLLLAIIPGLSGHAIYNWSMPRLDAVDVGVATLGEPVIGTILAWIIFSEYLTTSQFIAIGFLLIAISLTIELEKAEHQSS